MTPPEHKSIKEYKALSFFKDFSTGCFILLLLGLLVFVLAPLVILGVKIAFWLAVPVVAIIILIALTTLLGRLISKTRQYWQNRQS